MSSPETSSTSSTDLFLSYHRPDRESVQQVQQILEAQGISTFVDYGSLYPGTPWGEALERALSSVRAVAVFIGPELGLWQKREMAFALDRQVQEQQRGHHFPVIPVLLPGAGDLASSFLALNTWVDLRNDLTAAGAMAQLVKATRGETLAEPGDATAAICPYQGLRAFREEHAAFFFGRRILSERLLEMVVSGRDLVAVIGASGSGKSSVVHAGLLPLLRRQRPPAWTWDAVSFTPGNRPFHRLAASMLPLLDPAIETEADRMVEAVKIGDLLASGHGRIEERAEQIIARSKGTDRLLIIVDQFEELFTQTSEDDRRQFIQAVVGAFGRAPLQFVLTVRADYYGHLIGSSAGLSDRVEQGLLNVGAMSRAEIEATIVEPATKLGLSLEPGLMDSILKDVEQEPGQLPLLQFALTELWNRRRARVMTHAAYEEFGGVAAAISHRADAELKRCNSKQQETIRRIFSRLVHVALPDEGGEDTRQRASVAAMGIAVRPLIDMLTDARLLVTSRDDTGGETVEVAHEALIRGWGTLRSWLNQDREFLLGRQRLRRSLTQWEDMNKDPGALLHGAVLTEASRWQEARPADLSENELEFIALSAALARDAHNKEVKARRNKIRALAGALAVTLLLAGAALWQWRRAVNEREIALAQSLISQARLIRDTDPSKFDAAALLAIESEKIQPSAEADSILREAILLLPKEISRFQLKCDVMNAAFAPGGRFLACTDTPGRSVKIVSMADGRDSFVLPIPDFSEISVLAPSPDANFVLAGFRRAGFKLFEAEQRNLLASAGAGLRATAAAFAESGKHAATAVFDPATNRSTLQLLSIPDGATVQYPFPLLPRVQSLTFSPDSRFLAASHEGRTGTNMDVTIFDLIDTQNRWLIPGGSATANLALSSGAKLIAFSRDYTVRLNRVDLEAKTGDDVVALSGHKDFIQAIALSQDGQYMASGSHDGTAQVIETGTGALIARIPAASPVQSVGFTKDNNLVLLSEDGLVRTVDFANRPAFQVSRSVSGQIVNISPGGQYFTTLSRTASGAAGDSNSQFEVAVNDRMTGTKLWSRPVTRDVSYGPDRLRYSDDEKYFTVISRDHGVRVYDAKTGQELFHNSGAPDLLAHSTSGDGKTVALAGPKSIQVFQTLDGGRQNVLDVPNVRLLEMNRDGSLLVAGLGDAVVSVHDVQTRSELSRIQHDEAITRAAFSIDDQYLLTSSGDRTLMLSSVQNGRVVWRLTNMDVSYMVFAHDGRTIAVIDHNQVFKFIDTATGKTTASIQHPEGAPPVAAAFALDGSYVDIASEMSAQRHFLIPAKLIEQACSVLTRNIPRTEWTALAPGMPYRPACPNLPQP